MSDREQDKRVAEILGFVVVHEHWMRPIDQPDNYRAEQRLPRFTTNPSADYKVLEWARKQLSVDMVLFVEQLELIWPDYEVLDKGRVYEENKPFMSYQPGDYSRALLALDEQGLLK